MGMIHWNKQKEVPGTYKQHAWSDSSEITVPFTLDANDKRSDQELRDAFYTAIAPRSSSRTYGTSYSILKLDRKAGIATLLASTYIGD